MNFGPHGEILSWLQWKTIFQQEQIKDTNSPPWIDNEVRHFIRKKYLALKKYRQNKSETRKRRLRELSRVVKSLVKRKHKEYLNKIEKSFSTNPNVFWTYHKQSYIIGPTRLLPSCTTVCTAKYSADKVNYLTPILRRCLRNPVLMNMSRLGKTYENYFGFSELQVSVQEVEYYLRNLDVTKASGPDGIPARLLKECSCTMHQIFVSYLIYLCVLDDTCGVEAVT